jgi:hydrogenase-4 component B
VVGDVTERLVLGGIALAAASGVPGLFLGRRSRLGERLALGLLAGFAGLTMLGALRALLIAHGPLDLPGSLPGGPLRVEVDPLSAMFLISVAIVPLLGAVYGLGYWPQRDHPDDGRKLRLFYGLVCAGMAFLIVARSAVVFLAGWEVMALAAFLLVSTTDRDREVREAGYLYLVATRLATLCLFAMFALLYRAHGTFLFLPSADARGGLHSAVFLLGLVGFGIKAGLLPFHVWLPGAHASAPSHVSALMSGVLIKMGIYGFVRLTALYPSPPLWWGALVLGLGIVSGILGVALAIGQHDLKRLLAYHSVENIGIIFVGLGLALVGRSLARADLVLLGMAGALLHVWNHGLFKGLLFLAAGSVVHGTGTRQIDRLGGLLRSMPRTGAAFVVGAVAICGLPPLNGFISEVLIYLGLLRSANTEGSAFWLASALAAVALALIGALAVACFVKVLGAVFLGEPRSEAAGQAHEAPATMTAPMGVLAALCALIGLGPTLVAPLLDRAAAAWAPTLSHPRAAALAPLGTLGALSAVLLALVAAGAGWLWLRTRRAAPPVPTWDCGYLARTARMQYTASSFGQTLVEMFSWALRPRVHRPALSGPFPAAARFESHVADAVLDDLLVPAGRGLERGLRWFRWVQRGSVHAYLVYILATLVWLLVWQGGL